MPSAHYKSQFALSYSGMKELRKSPQHFFSWHHNPNRKSSPAMALGTLMHLLLLQPEREKTDVAVWTGKRRDGKVWDAFKDLNSGKEIVTPKELGQARAMVASMLQNPFIKSGMGRPDAQAELEWFGMDPEFDCPIKCTWDWLTPDLIFDPKKTGETIEEFETKSIWNYSYHIQAAFYLRCAEIMDGRKREFAWPVIEDDPPFASQLILPPPQMLDEGRRIVEERLRTFSRCWHDKVWPGYETQMKIAEVPEWIMKRMAV